MSKDIKNSKGIITGKKAVIEESIRAQSIDTCTLTATTADINDLNVHNLLTVNDIFIEDGDGDALISVRKNTDKNISDVTFTTLDDWVTGSANILGFTHSSFNLATGVFTAPKDRKYTFTTQILWDHSTGMSASNGLRYCEFFWDNGMTTKQIASSFVQPYADTSIPTIQTLIHTANLSENDTVQIRVYQNSGVTRKIGADYDIPFETPIPANQTRFMIREHFD